MVNKFILLNCICTNYYFFYLIDLLAINVFMLIHGVLKPNSFGKENKKKKYSIIDSQDSFTIKIKDAANFKNETNRILIVIEGEGDTVQTFYVYFDEIKIKFESYVDSIVFAFKLYKTLNVKFPIQCINVWYFIQTFFFDIDVEFDSPYVKTFINDLKHV